VLVLASRSPREFSNQQLFLEAVAVEIAVGIKNTLSLQELKSQMAVLEATNITQPPRKPTAPKTESGLLKNLELLQIFFDGTPDPMMLLDDKLRVRLMNQATRKHYRVQHEFEPGADTCHELFWNRTTPCNGCQVASNLRCQTPMTFESKSIAKPDCTEKVSLFPINPGARGAKEFIVHISDISKEKHIEKGLQQADKMISLGVLVSGVAHEINNPNNWTLINAPILAETWKDILPILDAYHGDNGEFKIGGLDYSEMRKTVPRLLDGILEGSKRIMRIVEELKNYSRQEPDKNRAALDINDSLKKAVSLVSKQIEKSTNTFSVSYGQDIPSIYGNSQKLEQVVINLLLNACQALPDSNRGISLRSFFDEPSNKVVFSVRDEGLGIPENVISRIMDPFFTTKRHMGGTGLGLSVSSKIVQDHGGELTVNSKPGKGATFSVLLPTEQRIEKIKVLVADDDELVRDVITRSLHRTQRFFVKEAANGIETCFMLGMETPDILILDINMPDMDGLEVCRQIHKTEALKDLKVIVITGDHRSDKARAMVDMGFGNILPKPLAPSKITGMVEAVLRGEEINKETGSVGSAS
jgi:signal transduction histidine kinase